MLLRSAHVFIALALGKYRIIDRSAGSEGKWPLTVF